MGLILDSSVAITAERKGATVEQLLRQIFALTGNQEALLPTVALVELAHGIHRANTPQIRARREAFIMELLDDVPAYPLTQEIALIAGKIDAEQQSKGAKIPFQDLLLGATALTLGYAVVTGNARHFQMLPGLLVTQL